MPMSRSASRKPSEVLMNELVSRQWIFHTRHFQTWLVHDDERLERLVVALLCTRKTQPANDVSIMKGPVAPSEQTDANANSFISSRTPHRTCTTSTGLNDQRELLETLRKPQEEHIEPLFANFILVILVPEGEP